MCNCSEAVASKIIVAAVFFEILPTMCPIGELLRSCSLCVLLVTWDVAHYVSYQ